jgi:CheY-like chemotaxis protein
MDYKKIIHCYNGKECVDFLAKKGNSSNIKAILMDIDMPIMDGL